jgi:hypothetical protein
LNAPDNDDLNVFMTGEANLHLCGNTNSQNCLYWTNENPRITLQKPIHSKEVIVSCGVASFEVIGPYFLEDKAGKAVNVNSARYSEMLRTFLELVLKPRLSGFSKTGQRLTLRGLQCESYRRCSDLA